MFALWSWAASLIATIVTALSRLDGLLLRSRHVAVLAEAPQVIRHMRAVREDVVHLVRLIATEDADTTIPFEDRAPNLLPVLRELLTAPRLPTPRHQGQSDATRRLRARRTSKESKPQHPRPRYGQL